MRIFNRETHDRTGKRLINAYNDLDKYFSSLWR